MRSIGVELSNDVLVEHQSPINTVLCMPYILLMTAKGRRS